MKKVIKIFTVIAISAITMYSCKTEKTTTANTTKTETVTFECTDAIGFANSIQPIMEASCVKCHSGANPKHGIDLTTYENVKKATGHNLLCTVQGGERCPKMPPFGGPLSAEEVSKIDCWIKNGMAE